MDRDYSQDAVTDPDVERRMQDAATALLDVCIHSMPASCQGVAPPMGGAMALAVQAIFMADQLQIGKQLGERGMTAEQHREFLKSMPERFTGLGVGLGHCIASLPPGPLQAIAGLTLTQAIDNGIAQREKVWKALGK